MSRNERLIVEDVRVIVDAGRADVVRTVGYGLYVAALLLSSALEGALANVRINLPGISDAGLADGFRNDAELAAKKAAEAMEKVRALAKAKELAA